MFRASQGEKADSTFDSQVVQHEPAHQGSINTVTNLSPDLCVSGGSDQVIKSTECLIFLKQFIAVISMKSTKHNQEMLERKSET